MRDRGARLRQAPQTVPLLSLGRARPRAISALITLYLRSTSGQRQLRTATTQGGETPGSACPARGVRAARAQLGLVEFALAVRPALALTAAEEVETIRRVLLEAATSTTRETWATCTCPECGEGSGKRSPSPITVPGSRPSRRCSVRGSVGLVRGRRSRRRCRIPIAEVRRSSWNELCLIFAATYAPAIRSVVDHGDEALRSGLEQMGAGEPCRAQPCARTRWPGTPPPST